MRISDWSSDVCSSDLGAIKRNAGPARPRGIVDLAGGDDVELGQPAGIGFGRVELRPVGRQADAIGAVARSEEHTSELQSPMRSTYAVFCLKKKTINKTLI